MSGRREIRIDSESLDKTLNLSTQIQHTEIVKLGTNGYD